MRHANFEMVAKCFLCGRCIQDAQEISFYTFPEDEDHRKKWLEAIGKTDAEVSVHSILCSRHFPQDCFVDSILMDDAIPILEINPTPYFDLITETGKKKEKEEKKKESGTGLLRSSTQCVSSSVVRPTIRRGRRIHMLSDEEMKNMQPIKYVRYLKNVNWDEISKVPEEAKIVWEVAMEELKENSDKIKRLHADVRQLNAIVQKLKTVLKTNKKNSRRKYTPLNKLHL